MVLIALGRLSAPQRCLQGRMIVAQNGFWSTFIRSVCISYLSLWWSYKSGNLAKVYLVSQYFNPFTYLHFYQIMYWL